MGEGFSKADAGRLQQILDDSFDRLYRFEASPGAQKRRAFSLLPDREREDLDLFLSEALSDDDDADEMNSALEELQDQLGDFPRAQKLLDSLREDAARTAMRCMELAYRYGKRKGRTEALDLLIPYVADAVKP